MSKKGQVTLPPALADAVALILENTGNEIVFEDRQRRTQALHRVMDDAPNISEQQLQVLRDRLRKASDLLLSYAHTAAIYAVRESNSDRITRGVVALAIEGLQIDSRDTTVILSLLSHSAKLLCMNFGEVLVHAATIANPEFSRLVELFRAAPEEEVSIEAMGYREGSRRGEFIYKQIRD